MRRLVTLSLLGFALLGITTVASVSAQTGAPPAPVETTSVESDAISDALAGGGTGLLGTLLALWLMDRRRREREESALSAVSGQIEKLAAEVASLQREVAVLTDRSERSQ